MRKKQQKKRRIAAFFSDDLEGFVFIIIIASSFLAAWGIMLAFEAIIIQRSFDDFIAGLGTFIFFSIVTGLATRRL